MPPIKDIFLWLLSNYETQISALHLACMQMKQRYLLSAMGGGRTWVLLQLVWRSAGQNSAEQGKHLFILASVQRGSRHLERRKEGRKQTQRLGLTLKTNPHLKYMMLVMVHKLPETSALLPLSVMEAAHWMMCVAAVCPGAVQVKLFEETSWVFTHVDGQSRLYFWPFGQWCSLWGMALVDAGCGFSLCHCGQAALLVPWDQPCGLATQCCRHRGFLC